MMGVKTKEYEENNGEGVSWKMRGRKGYSGKNRKEDSNAGLKNEGEERESVFILQDKTGSGLLSIITI